MARLTRWNEHDSSRPSGRSSVVEHDLAKVGVEGSNPFARSKIPYYKQCLIPISQDKTRCNPTIGAALGCSCLYSDQPLPSSTTHFQFRACAHKSLLHKKTPSALFTEFRFRDEWHQLL
jgi:hypothetical protein